MTDANVLDYLRLYCHLTRGPKGVFTIADEVYEGRQDDGAFWCKTRVRYGGSYFLARFEVWPSGIVQMIWDEPISK